MTKFIALLLAFTSANALACFDPSGKRYPIVLKDLDNAPIISVTDAAYKDGKLVDRGIVKAHVKPKKSFILKVDGEVVKLMPRSDGTYTPKPASQPLHPGVVEVTIDGKTYKWGIARPRGGCQATGHLEDSPPAPVHHDDE